MESNAIPEKRNTLAAIGYLPPTALFVYLWGKSANQRFHGYQGIALIAYTMVALLITDIVCGLIRVSAPPYLVIVSVIYLCVTVIFAALTFLGKNIDMKIYKSHINGKL